MSLATALLSGQWQKYKQLWNNDNYNLRVNLTFLSINHIFFGGKILNFAAPVQKSIEQSKIAFFFCLKSLKKDPAAAN
jgi:hypothetical protein